MGDRQNRDLRVGFDSRLKLKFLGSQITTDAGLLAYRELEGALGLSALSVERLQDSRLGQNQQHGLLPLLCQSVSSRLAGYEDVDDARGLHVDPAMRHVVGGRASQPVKQAASTREVGRFETEILSTKGNLTALMNLSGRWIDQVHRRRPLKELILDLDSSVSETYGRQQGTAYNGHFECTCYHPLFLFNQFGDLALAMLRRGNNASAKFWRRVLLQVIERYRKYDIPKFYRGDAAFGIPELYASCDARMAQSVKWKCWTLRTATKWSQSTTSSSAIRKCFVPANSWQEANRLRLVDDDGRVKLIHEPGGYRPKSSSRRIVTMASRLLPEIEQHRAVLERPLVRLERVSIGAS